MKNVEKSFEYLSKSELLQELKQIKESHIPESQAMYIIKRLLSTASEPEYIIEEIPNIIVCSSSEFLELLPSFQELITDNPLCVSKLLQILNSFDYDSQAKRHAHDLALQIFDKIGNDQIPDLFPFLLFTASKNSIPVLFNQLRDMLTFQENPLIYKSLEVGIRPHLAAFFHCLLMENSANSASRWTFFDFFLLLISQARPSLRSQIPSLVWSALTTEKLTIELLIEFCECKEILRAHFNFLSSLFGIIINNIPRCYETSSAGVLSRFAIHLVNSYPEDSPIFVDDLMSYVLNGTNFQAEVACHSLLSISPRYYASHITELDDCLSQKAGFISNTAVQTLCSLISLNQSSGTSQNDFQQNSSVLMISLQKKLFSTSQILVEAGVEMALHFASFTNFDEILEWVLKAIRVDRLVEASLRPSVLISVVDLIWSKLNQNDQDLSLFDEIMNFCADVINTFGVVVELGQNDCCIGSERNKFAVSSKSVPTKLHATLCGEVLFLTSFLVSQHKERTKSFKSAKITSNQLNFLSDISAICFLVPIEFIKIVSEPDAETKVKTIHIHQIENTREMIIPLMYRMKPGDLSAILLLMDIVNNIDKFFQNDQIAHKRAVTETFENTIFPLHFAIPILSECFFDFPGDINFVYLLMKSLKTLVVETTNHRFSPCDKISYLSEKMPEAFPVRIMTLVESMINLSVLWRKEKKISLVKECIKSAAFGIDFVCFCISCGIHTNLDFNNDVMDILEINEDAGIACKLILLGAFLGIEKFNLAQLASQCFIGSRISCDLSNSSFVYPFGFDHLNETVKPFNDGESWRLLVFLSLQFSDFALFKNQFIHLLTKINEGLIEIQMSVLLTEIMIFKMSDFFENFDDICEICYKTISLLIHRDLTTLRLILKLIHELNNLKKKVVSKIGQKDLANDKNWDDSEEISQKSKSFDFVVKIKKILMKSFEEFKGIQKNDQLKFVIAQIRGECDLLVENHEMDESSDLESDDEGEKVRKSSIRDPFDTDSSSDREFKDDNDLSDDSSVNDSIDV